MGNRVGVHRWIAALAVGAAVLVSGCSSGGGSASDGAPAGTQASGDGDTNATQPPAAGAADTDNAWCTGLIDVITSAGFQPVADGKLPNQPEAGGCYWSGDSMILYRKPAEGDIDKYLKDNSLLAPLTDIDGLGDSKGFLNRLHNVHWVWQGQYYTLVLCGNQVDDCDAKTTTAAQAIDKSLKGG
jgi:hypothetical protein